MATRMETPDMFDYLMGGTIQQESNNEIKPESNKAIKQEIAKEKSTFNLSVPTLDQLEEAWVKLRKQFKDKGRITKSLIVERAIALAIKDLQDNGEYSTLSKDLEFYNNSK